MTYPSLSPPLILLLKFSKLLIESLRIRLSLTLHSNLCMYKSMEMGTEMETATVTVFLSLMVRYFRYQEIWRRRKVICSKSSAVSVMGFSPVRERLTWEGEILGYTGGFSPERGLARLREEGSNGRVKSWAILEDSRLSEGVSLERGCLA
ncbi:hypothetical protein Lal_00037665 [Lupinus albus]|nr:hypothetical protein Lal_00037665 [Lupinus albus]